MKLPSLAVLVLLFSSLARADAILDPGPIQTFGPDEYNPLLNAPDVMHLTYGYVCASGLCDFGENWNIYLENGVFRGGVFQVFGTEFPINNPNLYDPAGNFSLVNAIDMYIDPVANGCNDSNYLPCDLAASGFNSGLPFKGVVDSYEQALLNDPPPVATPEPSTFILLCIGVVWVCCFLSVARYNLWKVARFVWYCAAFGVVVTLVLLGLGHVLE